MGTREDVRSLVTTNFFPQAGTRQMESGHSQRADFLTFPTSIMEPGFQSVVQVPLLARWYSADREVWGITPILTNYKVGVNIEE